MKPIIVPREAVISWINFVLFPYLRDRDKIAEWAIEKRWYTQEYLQAGGEIELANYRFFIDSRDSETVASGIEYSKCVLNYGEIAQMVADPELFRVRLLDH